MNRKTIIFFIPIPVPIPNKLPKTAKEWESQFFRNRNRHSSSTWYEVISLAVFFRHANAKWHRGRRNIYGPPVATEVIQMPHVIMTRADEKSQVRQCLGFCTADCWSLLAYELAKQ